MKIKNKKNYKLELIKKNNLLYRNEVKENSKHSASLSELYRFCDPTDKCLLALMILASIANGLSFPINTLVFKDVVNLLVFSQPVESNFSITNTTRQNKGSHYFESLQPMVIKFGIIALCSFLAAFLQRASVSLLSKRLGNILRCELFAAVTRQEATWIDSQQTGNLVVKMSEDIEKIETAVSDKISQLIQNLTTFSISLVVAFCQDWILSLIALIAQPLMCLVFLVVIHLMRGFATHQIRAYAVAGGVAEEILAGLRAVVASNAQESEVKRYGRYLKDAENHGIKNSICQGAASGSISLILYCVSGLVFYMGIQFFGQEKLEAGTVVLTFLLVVIGSISLGSCIPQVESLIHAKTAGYQLYKIIDRKPQIDYRESGVIPKSFNGDIELKNVTFQYPSRPHATVLENFSFTIPQGKRVAFIGASGSGKSTIIQLLQRFYDPTSGSVSLGGKDVRELDLQWYRSHIGVVHQEPTLFSGSISDQIRLGKTNATDEEVFEAARRANAYDFIMATTKQFDTEISDIGSGFSGGQKQRIAIATALIGKRGLLILDEATSALDTVSEKKVQDTLDENMSAAGNTVTVVMVAHRLQTVRNADIIVVMKPGGEIVEQGNHDELMELQGMYYKMLQKQNSKSIEDGDSDSDQDMCALNSELVTNSIGEIGSKWSIASKDTGENFIKRTAIRDFIRLMKLNRPEAAYLTLGLLSSVILGIIPPFASLIYAQMFQVFSLKYSDEKRMYEKGYLFSCIMCFPGILICIFQILKQLGFGNSGEALTTRVRSMLMEAILNQEMAWFDNPENQIGMLTSRLALEATLIKGAAGPQLGIFVETGTSLIAVIFIGFYYSWQLALLLFIMVPLLMLTGIMQTMHTTTNTSYTPSTMQANGIMLECINKLKVVHSLNVQDHFHRKFVHVLKSDKSSYILDMILDSTFYGIGSSAMVIGYCVVFSLGGYLMDIGQVSMISLMRVFSCMTLTSTSMGRAFALTPDLEKSCQATCSILNTIDRVPTIDSSSKGSGFIPDKKLSGLIEFKDVKFRYPSRPKIIIFRKLNLQIEAHQNIALVGHSGCGKSTIIQILMRFYDPSTSSQVCVDGYDIRSLNLRWLRSQIGLVQQEPNLFNVSVQDNICLGATEVDMERVQAAAKAANIHDFITTLPEGYDTRVGQRGGHLSGGQKQRLCIARALYSDPALLLLDEATSAMDNESEAVVQEALTAASRGRTSVTVAHRLTTVRDCDAILVLEQGRVAEAGSHDRLMAHRGGIYNRLYSSIADTT